MSSQKPDIIVGKIHCVAVKNFVTYDEVVMYAGEYLNIILGPNGTGKSTIVAAIILGMGGNPKLLSRSSNIDDYIKNGKESAWIQIKIYRNVQKATIAFERQINSNAKSEFKVDGKLVTEKEYIRHIAGYNIQIDNLCQFLPQDRVQDFAKMNPQEILISTLKSVCEQNMMGTFEKLKELRKTQLNSQKSLVDHQQKLKTAQQKYETLKDVVDNMNKRRSLVQKIEVCVSKKHWLECAKIQSELETFKTHLEQQLNFVKRDEENFQSVKKRGREVLTTIDNITKNQQNEEQEALKWLEQYEKLKEDCQKLQSDIRLARSELWSKKREDDERETRLEQANSILHVYVQDLRNQQEICGTEDEQREKRQQFSSELERLRTEKERLIDKCRELNRALDNYQPQLQAVKRKIDNLKNIPIRRLNMIRDSHGDVYQAVLWLRQNRHIFQGHVYEPMLLELNVRNADNAKYLENSVAFRDLIAFTCVCKSDVDLLTRKLRNEQNLHINVIYSEEANECTFRSNEPINCYEQFGFYSYLIDMIEGPAPILNYLCRAYRLHEIMIGNERVDNYSDELPTHIRLFFGGNYKYSVMVSKYSKQKSSLREEIKSKNLFCMSINMTEMNKLEKQHHDITKETDVHKNQRTRIEGKILEYDEQRKEILENKKDFEGKLMQLQQHKDQVRLQMYKVDQIKNGAIDVQAEEKKHDEYVKETLGKILRIKNEEIKCLTNCQQHEENSERYRCKLNLIKEENSGIEREIMNAQDVWRKSRETYDTIQAKHENCKKNYREKLKEARELCDGKSPGDENFPYTRVYKRVPNTTEELDDVIEDLRSRVECMNAENQSVFEEYEEVKKTIQNLEELISNVANDDNQNEDSMKKLHDKWYQKLCEIIENINEHFTKFMSSMSYAGEVQLHRNNERDYDEYGIKIMVQYRDSAKLQALDRFVQSGGERAVAIAVYTLSLQHLTNVPFRCVDEINQGMDVINERKIFNMIVQETSHPGNSQYFFITPKFTSGFNYNDSMQVHVVFNGKFVSSSNDFNCK